MGFCGDFCHLFQLVMRLFGDSKELIWLGNANSCQNCTIDVSSFEEIFVGKKKICVNQRSVNVPVLVRYHVFIAIDVFHIKKIIHIYLKNINFKVL